MDIGKLLRVCIIVLFFANFSRETMEARGLKSKKTSIRKPQKKRIGPQKKRIGPQKKRIGPQKKKIGPQKKRIGLQKKRIGPQKKKIGPQKKRIGPQKKSPKKSTFKKPGSVSPKAATWKSIPKVLSNVSSSPSPASAGIPASKKTSVVLPSSSIKSDPPTKSSPKKSSPKKSSQPKPLQPNEFANACKRKVAEAKNYLKGDGNTVLGFINTLKKPLKLSSNIEKLYTNIRNQVRGLAFHSNGWTYNPCTATERTTLGVVSKVSYIHPLRNALALHFVEANSWDSYRNGWFYSQRSSSQWQPFGDRKKTTLLKNFPNSFCSILEDFYKNNKTKFQIPALANLSIRGINEAFTDWEKKEFETKKTDMNDSNKKTGQERNDFINFFLRPSEMRDFQRWKELENLEHLNSQANLLLSLQSKEQRYGPLQWLPDAQLQFLNNLDLNGANFLTTLDDNLWSWVERGTSNDPNYWISNERTAWQNQWRAWDTLIRRNDWYALQHITQNQWQVLCNLNSQNRNILLNWMQQYQKNIDSNPFFWDASNPTQMQSLQHYNQELYNWLQNKNYLVNLNDLWITSLEALSNLDQITLNVLNSLIGLQLWPNLLRLTLAQWQELGRLMASNSWDNIISKAIDIRDENTMDTINNALSQSSELRSWNLNQWIILQKFISEQNAKGSYETLMNLINGNQWITLNGLLTQTHWNLLSLVHDRDLAYLKYLKSQNPAPDLSLAWLRNLTPVGLGLLKNDQSNIISYNDNVKSTKTQNIKTYLANVKNNFSQKENNELQGFGNQMKQSNNSLYWLKQLEDLENQKRQANMNAGQLQQIEQQLNQAEQALWNANEAIYNAFVNASRNDIAGARDYLAEMQQRLSTNNPSFISPIYVIKNFRAENLQMFQRWMMKGQCVISVAASRFNALEVSIETKNKNPNNSRDQTYWSYYFRNMITDYSQGPAVALQSLTGTFLRLMNTSLETALNALCPVFQYLNENIPGYAQCCLPNGFNNKTNQNVFWAGFLELGNVENVDQLEKIKQCVDNHIKELAIPVQKVKCELTDMEQVQVFLSAPNLSDRSTSWRNWDKKGFAGKSPLRLTCDEISEKLIVAQYEAVGKLACLLDMPVFLPMVGMGVFENDKTIMPKALMALLKVVNGKGIPIYLAGEQWKKTLVECKSQIKNLGGLWCPFVQTSSSCDVDPVAILDGSMTAAEMGVEVQVATLNSQVKSVK
jgi:hypothetical protein